MLLSVVIPVYNERETLFEIIRRVLAAPIDIDRELAAEELKKTLARQAQSESLYDIIEETKQSIEMPAEAPVKTDHSSTEPTTDKQHDANG